MNYPVFVPCGHPELDELQELIALGADGCLSDWERDRVRDWSKQYDRESSLSGKQRHRITQIHEKAFKNEKEGV